MTHEEILRERVAKLEVQMAHLSEKLDDTHKKVEEMHAMVDALGVDQRGAPFHAVDDVVLRQQKLGEIAAVLARHSGDQRNAVGQDFRSPKASKAAAAKRRATAIAAYCPET